ncbi:lipoxygenase [Chloropicon primus]|uniref:Lipoxygenase n=1 Tax=Chloropicon primus TaxID=1764295 RepID=A0A5B8MIC2_9CHLO|nr:lipoxygenase [Chloropicon primus]UPQ99446.1 lipoxygenase [Chloropicon primus]|eukprot:QDZ20236.1 lipoxygenase [Chloropicon primus]
MGNEIKDPDHLAKTQSSKLLRFHVLQGFNYLFAGAYFAYLALYGSEAKPHYVSKLWMQLEDPPLNPLERTLLAMFWLCPSCIGLGYLLIPKHLESVYGSFLTMSSGVILAFRLALTPAQYLTLIIFPVDFGGILYKLRLLREEFWAIPKESRKILWNVPEAADRSTMSRLLEFECYFFAVYLYVLSFVSTDVLLPGCSGTRVAPFSKIFFGCQAVVFVYVVPGLRQGKNLVAYMLLCNKAIVSCFLIKGIFFDGVIPNTMGAWVLLPYVTTLAFEFHLLLWKRVMRYSIFSRYVTRRQASSAKYFSMLFAVLIVTLSNTWYICTGSGLASISKTYGSFLDRLAFLPGTDENADRVRFLDAMLAGVLFLFVIALEEVLAKKNTARVVSRIHFVLTIGAFTFSIMFKVFCNLDVKSSWHGTVAASDHRVGMHCIYWVVNAFLRVAFPLACLFVLCNVDGPISSWTISMKGPKKTKSRLASTIVVQNTVRTAIKRTMIFHGMSMMMFASLASTLFTSGLPTFFPNDSIFGGHYIIKPLVPHSVDSQRSLFYVGLVIAFVTVIMGSALATIDGRALPVAQFLSAVWPLSAWAFLLDSWISLAYQRGSKLHHYFEPLFRGSMVVNSEHMTSIAVVGMGTAALSLMVVLFLRVRSVSVYNRKVQAPSDFAEELSHSHKQSYIFHSSVLVFSASVFMLRSCKYADTSSVGAIFKDYLFDDIVACLTMMNFGFVIYECKEGLHHRSFLSKVTSLKTAWILSGYVLFSANKALGYFGFSDTRIEMVYLVSYVVYNIVIQFQSARAVVEAIYFIRPSFNSNLPAILKSFNALSRSQTEDVDIALLQVNVSSAKAKDYFTGKLTKGNPNWKNNWAKHYIENFGENVYNDATAKEFPIPMPPPDESDLKKQQGKAALTFLVAASIFRRRPTHPVGVGAYGMFEVLDNENVPPTEFFVPGKIFHLRARHSNGVGVQTKEKPKKFDDAALEVRSLSIKLAKGRDDSPFDLNLNTGEFAGFYNLPSFRDFVYMSTMNDQKLFDKFAVKYPSCLMAEVDGFRRAPETFAQLHYYSQTCRSFNGLDGKRRYCKFRAVPYGKGPFTEVEAEPFMPDDDDQKRIVTKPMMSHHRLDDEKRPTDYLRTEFKNRVTNEVVRYRLQIQLHEWQANDTDEVFNANKAWGTPFHDIGIITLHTPMNDYETEQTSFNIGNCPRCISLVKPKSAFDYHTINWTRKAVYGKSSRIRRYFSKKKSPSFVSPCRYILDFHTSHVVFSGMDGNVQVTLVGTKGSTTEIFLENSAYDFEVDTVSRFVVYDEDIGDPLYMFVTHDADETWKRKLYNLDFMIPNKWNLGKVQVSSKSPIYGDKKTNFYVWRWMSKGELVFAIADNIPEDDPKVKSILPQLLDKYFQNKKSIYDWSSGDYLPNHLSAKGHGDLPEEEQFSSMKLKDFAVSAIEGLKNQKLVGLYFQEESFKSLDEYYKCLQTLPPFPPIENWHTDEEFGRQLMNGTHPVMFMRCSKIPENFKVNDVVLEGLLPAGKTLRQELDAGHIFIIDYKVLEDIPCAPGRYCSSGLGLLHADGKNSLKPIAIQLHQDGGAIWTPKDKPLQWLLAKLHLICADGNIHEMVTHLFSCHLVMEPWAVALERNVPSYHPVFRMLKPNLAYTIAINTIGRNTLIAKDGVSDKILSIGQGGHIEIMAKAYTYFQMYHLDLPEMLERRGVMDKDVLPSYYWRDDSMEIWGAYHKYAKAVLTAHYDGKDSGVRRDAFVQNLIRDVKFNGYYNEDPDYHGVPDSVDTIEQLAKLCTCVLFQTSCMHGSVNFSQYDYYSYVPNRPLTMRQPVPREKIEVDEDLICKNLPDAKGCARSIAAVWALSQFSDEEVFLGYSKMVTMDLPYQKRAIDEFRKDLKAIEAKIVARNEGLGKFGYTYLQPSRVPTSIAI